MIPNASIRPEALWGDVLPVLVGADQRLVNLECVISACGEGWCPQSKAVHFHAHTRAVEFLTEAKIDCVTLANNPVLDYGPGATAECLDLLDAVDWISLKKANFGLKVT